jgi:multidrug efflux pump subunit AcrA (membrane-fusion protein)
LFQELLDAKKDEISVLHEKSTSNLQEIDRLQKLLRDDESKAVLEARIKQLESQNGDLETKNKEHHEKLKKFAANLKKKVAQCTELEEKLAQSSADSGLKQKIVEYEEQINLMKREHSKLVENVQQSSVFENELTVIKTENEEMAQKMVYLNNELHRLIQVRTFSCFLDLSLSLLASSIRSLSFSQKGRTDT